MRLDRLILDGETVVIRGHDGNERDFTFPDGHPVGTMLSTGITSKDGGAVQIIWFLHAEGGWDLALPYSPSDPEVLSSACQAWNRRGGSE